MLFTHPPPKRKKILGPAPRYEKIVEWAFEFVSKSKNCRTSVFDQFAPHMLLMLHIRRIMKIHEPRVCACPNYLDAKFYACGSS